MVRIRYIFLSVIIGISIMQLTGCGSTSASTSPEPATISDTDSVESDMTEVETDIAMLSEDSQSQTDVEAESAVEELTAHLVFMGVMSADMQVDDGKRAEWIMEEIKEVEIAGIECYALDLRYSEDEAANGEMAGRLVGIYAVSKDGTVFYQYNQADDIWEQDEAENEADNMPEERPQLPATGRQLADFVPEGWEIMDSAELDFNEDGIFDYVGVLRVTPIQMDGYVRSPDYPRILFAIASDETEGYRLDFQDINLIRTRDEGGIHGDPYEPLTVEEVSFTTHAYGGSGWRWSEDYTYTYREGTWWLTLSEDTYGYGDYITDYSRNDWDSGVGIRKKRSDDWGVMEENWESEEYDAVYEIVMDEPQTLEQAGKRCWLAPDRVIDWSVEAIEFAVDMELSEDMVKLPDEAWIEYNDENCVLYAFNDEGFWYLAMYCWQDKVVSILAKEESEIEKLDIYNGKIYYSTRIEENIAYKTIWNDKEQIVEKEDTVGIRLHRMELDGTGKEAIFEYRYPGTEQEIMESKIQIPSMWLSYEISGDEIVAEIHMGSESNPIYRMKTDGSECKKIGQLPKE